MSQFASAQTASVTGTHIGAGWDYFQERKISVRAGYGIFHDRVSVQLVGLTPGNPPFQQLFFEPLFGPPPCISVQTSIPSSRVDPHLHMLPLGDGASLALEVAQTPPAVPKEDSEANHYKRSQLISGREISWKRLLPNVLEDQKQIWWEFPKDLAQGKHWLPTSVVVAGTAGLIALDPHDAPYFRRTSTFDGFNRVMGFNVTIAAMAAVPATTYVVGVVSHKSYAKQTVELTAEL